MKLKTYTKEEIMRTLSMKKIKQTHENKLNEQLPSSEGLQRLKEYSLTLSCEEGSRNHNVMLISRQGLALGVSKEKIIEVIHNFCDRAGFDMSEAIRVLSYQDKYHSDKPFEPIIGASENQNHELARAIISSQKEPISGNITFCTVCGILHRYEGGVYVKVDDLEFPIEIRRVLNKIPCVKPTKNKVSEVIENIKSETLYRGKGKNAFFVHKNTEDRYIAMLSKIFNLTKAMNGEIDQEILTARFFSTAKLPYDFIQDVGCPTFFSILNRILPHLDDQKMLQCWFGYHLFDTVSYGKFLILIGSGANGKSVVLKVLRLFLGSENVSAVPIESFNNKRTFAVAETYGKLANIYDEMSSKEIDEAFIKNYVTGGQIQAERKYAHPFTFIPTAKLTFSTNVMPEIKDRSDGFWRRSLILEFKERLQASEQNQQYIEDQFWIKSGELSGVFNWALEGAKYLLQNKQLFQSENSKFTTEQVRIESDSARSWISENIVNLNGAFLPKSEVYRLYSENMKSQGQKPCVSREFYNEIDKLFPNAISQNHPINIKGGRYRGWYNLTISTTDTGIS